MTRMILNNKSYESQFFESHINRNDSYKIRNGHTNRINANHPNQIIRMIRRNSNHAVYIIRMIRKSANHANHVIRLVRKTCDSLRIKNIRTEKYSLRITFESYDLQSSGLLAIS